MYVKEYLYHSFSSIKIVEVICSSHRYTLACKPLRDLPLTCMGYLNYESYKHSDCTILVIAFTYPYIVQVILIKLRSGCASIDVIRSSCYLVH